VQPGTRGQIFANLFEDPADLSRDLHDPDAVVFRDLPALCKLRVPVCVDPIGVEGGEVETGKQVHGTSQVEVGADNTINIHLESRSEKGS
jgi:hypothetical protein